ncbi:MAG: HAD-IIIA family hydrolase [Nitrospirota bacterium]|nr:MAG: HAD-IIIA family hydrolase [Nitrospirota bacterium]
MPSKTKTKSTSLSRKRPVNDRSLAAKAKKIKLLIVDVDGVMTDGSIILDNNGIEYKRFNVRDGHGIKLLQRYGIDTAIITGRISKVVDIRAKELGIKHVYQRCLNKVVPYDDLKKKLSLNDNEIAYIGDDVVDIPLFNRVGLSVAVADAHKDVIKYVDMVTKEAGGKGAVRSTCDYILSKQGIYKGVIDGYSKA